MTSIFIAVQDSNPIPCGAKSDEALVCAHAQDWANYSKRNVHVLRISGPFVDVAHIVMPKDQP